MIKDETWQELGKAFTDGKRIFLNDLFRLFRKAGNERVRSVISGNRYSDHLTPEHPCAYLLGPDGCLLKYPFPLLDNWDDFHDFTQIPAADPDRQSASQWEYRVPTPSGSIITREYLRQVFENYNRLRHFPMTGAAVEKVFYCRITAQMHSADPAELCRRCIDGKTLQTVTDTLPFAGCTFDYTSNRASNTTTGVFSQSVVSLTRKGALKDNGFSAETFVLPFTISAPSSSGSVYYASPDGTSLQPGETAVISPENLVRSSINDTQEDLAGEYISPVFNTGILQNIDLEAEENISFRAGYSSTGSVYKQRNEYSNFNKFLY